MPLLPETPPVPPRSRSAGATLATWAVALAICAFYLWTASSNTVYFQLKGEQDDYYNRLSHGFLEGHLYMKVAPLTQKAREADDLGLGLMPFLLDASFYRGKYYLYFGPTPVLTAFLPYRLLTGNDISDNLVAALFACGGYLVSFCLLMRVAHRFFPGAPPRLMPFFAILLGLGNVCAVMLRHPMFYEAAIACAFFFQSLFLLALFLALTTPDRRRRVAWLAGASLACGLSVGARANYAFASLVLGFVLVWLWHRRENRPGRFPAGFGALVLAAVGPVTVCAIGLMAYNYLRFGNVLEFGVSYQFTYRPVFSLRFLPHNLKLYYFSLPELSWYFPYALPIDEGVRPAEYKGFEHIHGQFWSAIWLLPVAAAAVLLWRRRRAFERPLAVWYSCALFCFLINLLVLLCLGGRANRYMVDFQPTLMLLGATSALVWEREINWTTLRRWLAVAALVLVVGLIGLHNIFSSLQLYELLKNAKPHVYDRIATAMNAPTDWVGRWLYPRLGPVRVRVRFPSGHKGELEPLVVTGSAEYCDFLLVHYLGDGSVRFVLVHYGFPEIVSRPVQVGSDRFHDLEIDLGSLYPPLSHPFFQPFSRGERMLIRRTVRVSVDGEDVFIARHDFSDASPGRVYVGENPLAPLYAKARFSGSITDVRREGLAGLLQRKMQEQYGGLQMRLFFPAEMAGRGPEPLVVTGENSVGDAIFVKYEDDRHVRFGCDRWGAGEVFSNAIEVDPRVEHTLEIWMGSLLPPVEDPQFAGWPAHRIDQLKSMARVRLDGREVFRSPGRFHEADPRTVDLGGNLIGMSSAGALFGGTIEHVSRLAMPTLTGGASSAVPFGPIRMRVTFPANHTGRSEPLLTTGHAGGGDVVFVTYLDDKRVSFSFDHGGKKTITSVARSLNFGVDHIVEIDLGSLYPPQALEELSVFSLSKVDKARRQVSVSVDGQPMLLALAEYYPALAQDVVVGANAVGASTCEAAFGGTITQVERVGFGPPAPARNSEDYGPVLVVLGLPKDRIGQAEPLLVTGGTGAADALIVAYADDHHIKLTWDHWGRGGPSSELLAVDYDELHRLEIDMGSLYPDGSAAMKRALSSGEIARRRETLQVKLDGQTVLSTHGTFHSAPATRLQIGNNPIGLSSANEMFTGSIEQVQRPGVRPVTP